MKFTYRLKRELRRTTIKAVAASVAMVTVAVLIVLMLLRT